MTRGKKPAAAIGEAKGFAERMGYRWQENTDPDLLYDLIIFKPASIRLVKIRQTRYRIDPESFYEDLFPDELHGLRELPFPVFIPRRALAPHPTRTGLATSDRPRLIGW